MKNKRTYHTSLTFLLTFLILFQSCTVYKKQPVTLEEASQAKTKAKVKMADGSVSKYYYIGQSQGAYHGVKPKEIGSKKMIKEELAPNEVLSVRIKNKKASNWFSLGAAGLLSAGALTLLYSWANTLDYTD
ncbi:hypothetical protein ACT6NV_04330 [Robiginitalea sp. IMCC44478]|uniref:hypothetical protein n=1 Tax=Robiginitalea sp. IMCC44478 TaxID=3459122 RepID=UPI004041A371